MSTPDLIALAEQFTAVAAKRDAAAMARITRAYGSMYQRLIAQVEDLARVVVDGQMSRGQLARLSRYKALMGQIESELSDLSVVTRNELSINAESAVARALSDSRALVQAVTSQAGVTVAFNTLPRAAVMQLLGFLQPTSPLFARLKTLAPFHAQGIADLFLDGVGLGWNPRKIAAAIRKQFGMALVDALRMTRTAGLYAYREATRANYIANEDVVEGWYWLATLKDRTCPSCIRMHSTFHPNTERLNDHHNGRCAMIPAVKGFGNPIKRNGIDYFNSLSDAQKQALIGRDYFKALQDGLYSFDQISMEFPNDVYGPMRGVTPLWQLLGAESPLRTQ